MALDQCGMSDILRLTIYCRLTIDRTLSRRGQKRRQPIVLAGQVVDVESDLRELDLHAPGGQDDRRNLEEQHVRSPAGIVEGRRRGECLMRDLGLGTSTMSRSAVVHPRQEELAHITDGQGDDRQMPDEAASRRDTAPDAHVGQTLVSRLRAPAPGRQRYRTHHHRDQYR
jgi:hypothetical protein